MPSISTEFLETVPTEELIAVQRAIHHPAAERAAYCAFCDLEAWNQHIVGFPWVYERQWFVKPRFARHYGDAMKSLGVVWTTVEPQVAPGVWGAGPYSMMLAGHIFNADVVLMHGFECNGTLYKGQKKRLLAMKEHYGYEVYETPGSMLGVFDELATGSDLLVGDVG